MDKARYVIAVLLWITFLPAVVFWFIVHPFTEFWRRRGLAATYTVTFLAMGLLGYGMWILREPLLAVEFGTHWPLVALAALLYGIALVIEVLCRRHLKLRTLVGVPQLKGENDHLLNQGIYSRVRHPRYLDFIFGTFAFAVFANYLAVYILAVLLVPTLYLVTIFEERELAVRFGDAYRAYRERVPRFIPRLGAPRGPGGA